jgi:hypothetical protein
VGGSRHRADALAERAQGRFEVRSAGPGRTGPRWYEWAMIGADTPHHVPLIRRPLPKFGTPTASGTRGTDVDRPDGTSFVYCYVPEDSPITPTLPTLVLMAGRRWPVEETIATGKGPLGWDHHQYRTWTSLAHHTALRGLAMLKANALRARLETTSPSDTDHPDSDTVPVDDGVSPETHSPPTAPGRSCDTHDEVMIPRDDSLIPVRPDQPCPTNIGHIRLTLNETPRLVRIANAGLSRARTAFHLHWSRWRRRHQTIAQWHRWRARLATAQAAPT